MTGPPRSIMASIAEALPPPWTVEITFRTRRGDEVFTWYAPVEVTAPDQIVSVEVDLGSLQAVWPHGG